MKQYKHLFFDLDHTLWDFNANARLALIELFDELLPGKLNVPFEEFYERYIIHNETLWARYEKGFIGVEELKWRRMWRTLLDFKIADETLSKEMSARFLQLLPVKKEVFPYAAEILTHLRDKGYRLHLITNGFEVTQRMKLQHCGLDHFFEEIITSEISNSLKPKKEIFDFALSKTNALAEESIMIGDNLAADVTGALEAGWDAIYVNHVAGSAGDVKPTYTVTHLRELEDIFPQQA